MSKKDAKLLSRFSHHKRYLPIVAIFLVAIGLYTIQIDMQNQQVRKQDGLWIVEQRLGQEYHRYYPEQEQVAFMGNSGLYNISTERHMEVSCSSLVRTFVTNRTLRQLSNTSFKGKFSIKVGYKEPIEIEPYNQNHVPQFRAAAPDQVKCIVHFQDHTYSRIVNITVNHSPILNHTTSS